MMTLISRFRTGLLAVMMVLVLSLQAQATNFMARDHLVVDLRFGVEWLRCTVGKVWNGETCVGEAVRLRPTRAPNLLGVNPQPLGVSAPNAPNCAPKHPRRLPPDAFGVSP